MCAIAPADYRAVVVHAAWAELSSLDTDGCSLCLTHPNRMDWLSVLYRNSRRLLTSIRMSIITGFAIAPLAHLCVNQRSSDGNVSPFSAVFGKPPITLAALENPELLPQGSASEKSIKEVAVMLNRLHQQLHDAEVTTRKARRSRSSIGHRMRMCNVMKRRPVIGDKIWLSYSNVERSRYISVSMVMYFPTLYVHVCLQL